MAGSTTRGAFPYPTGSDNWKAIRTALVNLANQVAAVTTLYVESTAGTRPTAGTAGRFHRATDTGAVSFDTGTAWVTVPNDALPGTFATRAQGLSATRGAASRAGKFHYGTDTGLLGVDDGSSWHDFQDKASADAAYPSLAGGSTVATSGSSVRGLVVKGAASQSANLQEWQNSSGTILSFVSSAGGIQSNSGGIATGGTAQLNAGGNVDPNLFVSSQSASNRPLLVRGSASQTANLAEFQNSAGTLLAVVSAGGQVTGRSMAIQGDATSGDTLDIENRTGNPTSIAGYGRLYVVAGALRFVGSSGTVTTIAPA